MPSSPLEEEALGDWEDASNGAATASMAAVFGCSFIAEVIAHGQLEQSEANDIWAETVGSGVSEVDKETFRRFWSAVDALFEDADSSSSSSSSSSSDDDDDDSSDDEDDDNDDEGGRQGEGLREAERRWRRGRMVRKGGKRGGTEIPTGRV